jgi:hypothetical protein
VRLVVAPRDCGDTTVDRIDETVPHLAVERRKDSVRLLQLPQKLAGFGRLVVRDLELAAEKGEPRLVQEALRLEHLPSRLDGELVRLIGQSGAQIPLAGGACDVTQVLQSPNQLRVGALTRRVDEAREVLGARLEITRYEAVEGIRVGRTADVARTTLCLDLQRAPPVARVEVGGMLRRTHRVQPERESEQILASNLLREDDRLLRRVGVEPHLATVNHSELEQDRQAQLVLLRPLQLLEGLLIAGAGGRVSSQHQASVPELEQHLGPPAARRGGLELGQKSPAMRVIWTILRGQLERTSCERRSGLGAAGGRALGGCLEELRGPHRGLPRRPPAGARAVLSRTMTRERSRD